MAKYRKLGSATGLLENFLQEIIRKTLDLFLIFSRNIHNKNIYPPMAYILDGLVFLFLFLLIFPVLLTRLVINFF